MRQVWMMAGAALAATVLIGAASAADAPAAPPKSATIAPRAGTSEEVIIAPEEKRAQSPDGDPRSSGERHEDEQAYDRCMLHMQSVVDMAHPVDMSPEEYCQRHLGMQSRESVPDSVLKRAQ